MVLVKEKKTKISRNLLAEESQEGKKKRIAEFRGGKKRNRIVFGLKKGGEKRGILILA